MGEPHDLVLKYGRASAVLPEQDADLLAKLCERAKAFLHIQTTNLVRKCAYEPIAVSYTSYGTPFTTT